MRKVYSILIIGLGLLAGCNNNDDMTPAEKNDKRVPLQIVAGIDMQKENLTRAVETAWEADDNIGVYMTIHNNTSIIYTDDTKQAKNMLYTFDDGTNFETNGNNYRLFTPMSEKIFLSSTDVDVFGYYPYQAKKRDGTSEVVPTAVEINISNQNSQKAIDFMRAATYNINNNNTSIELLFRHRMVKLVFNLKQGEGLLENELNSVKSLTVSINNQPVASTYNIYTDAFSIMAAKEVVNAVRASSAPTGYVRTFEAIVLPNNATNPAEERMVTITFSRNNDETITNTFKIPGSTYFTSGWKYIYNVTVNATSIQVNPEKYTEQW